MDEGSDDVKLKHACVDGGQYGVNVSPDEYKPAGTRMIRTSDLAGRNLAAAEDGVYLGLDIPKAQVLEESDLLLSRAGTIGRSYLVPTDAAGMTFAGFLIRFRPTPDFDARFLQYAIQSKPVQEQISSQAVTSTMACSR
jgi:type I restriction enzyme, S subunit